MPDAAANSRPASSPLETAAQPRRPVSPASAPPHATQHNHNHNHHGAAIADAAPAATLPPALTPATTTRQSVSLGALSTLWGANAAPVIPAITTQAASPHAQEPPSADLTASTGSVPSTSTTTTLTNTLPPTQSAALRALNAPAFAHASAAAKSKSAKSTSTRTTLSSQPVVVRTYSGSRHSPRSSGFTSPRHPPSMNGHAPQPPSALSVGLAAGRNDQLPSADDFSFSAILRAVDPEIRDAIDAIAEICARSRMSLADEYDSHLPPQGEITGTGPGWAAGMGALVGRGRISRVGQGWTATENTLTAVPEASSSSERLAGEGSKSSKKRSQSAYGSLKSVISGGSGKRKASDDSFEEAGPSKHSQSPKSPHPAWAVHFSSPGHPAIRLVTSPQASKQLSFDTSSTITDIPESPDEEQEPQPRPQTAAPRQVHTHRRQLSAASLPPPRTRSSGLSSLTSWIPWPRPADLDLKSQQELTKAEARLREMLTMSQERSLGKGKAPLSVAS